MWWISLWCELCNNKNGITDACSTADSYPLLTICSRCCPRHASVNTHSKNTCGAENSDKYWRRKSCNNFMKTKKTQLFIYCVYQVSPDNIVNIDIFVDILLIMFLLVMFNKVSLGNIANILIIVNNFIDILIIGKMLLYC